jgi:large subunit ribosomal protein L4e
MFSPLRSYRRWHRKVNKGHKRYAVASALAASALPALVQARGHRISQIAEIPLVVANEAVENLGKTKKAVAVLKKLNAGEDLDRVKNTLVHRAGRGKMRNRPYKERLGPLLVHGSHFSSVGPAFANIAGLEIADVNKLNLLRLAPGGHLGRFIIWTRSAFEQLDKIWGTVAKPSVVKRGFSIPRTILHNPDIARLLRSDEILSSIRPKKVIEKRKKWVNPLRNARRMAKLNPYNPIFRKTEALKSEAGNKRHAQRIEAFKTGKQKKYKHIKETAFQKILHTD